MGTKAFISQLPPWMYIIQFSWMNSTNIMKTSLVDYTQWKSIRPSYPVHCKWTALYIIHHCHQRCLLSEVELLGSNLFLVWIVDEGKQKQQWALQDFNKSTLQPEKRGQRALYGLTFEAEEHSLAWLSIFSGRRKQLENIE